jgi:hypothetical protein
MTDIQTVASKPSKKPRSEKQITSDKKFGTRMSARNALIRSLQNSGRLSKKPRSAKQIANDALYGARFRKRSTITKAESPDASETVV